MQAKPSKSWIPIRNELYSQPCRSSFKLLLVLPRLYRAFVTKDVLKIVRC